MLLGLYRDDPAYKDCQNVTWNPNATALMFQDLNIPIIIITNSSELNFIKDVRSILQLPNIKISPTLG